MNALSNIILVGLMMLVQEAKRQYDFHNKPSLEKCGYVGGSYFFGDIGGRQNNIITGL
jgi:hypothetical protein